MRKMKLLLLLLLSVVLHLCVFGVNISKEDKFHIVKMEKCCDNDRIVQYSYDSLVLTIDFHDPNYMDIENRGKKLERHYFDRFFEGLDVQPILFYSSVGQNYILLLQFIYEYSFLYHVFEINNTELKFIDKISLDIISDPETPVNYHYEILKLNHSWTLRISNDLDNDTASLKIEGI